MVKIKHKDGKELVFKEYRAVNKAFEDAVYEAEIDEEPEGIFVGAFTFKVDKITKNRIYVHSVSF